MWTENFQMYKLGLKGIEEPEINICWIMEKAREIKKNIYFCFTDYAKAFDCVDHNKLCEILKEMGIPWVEAECWMPRETSPPPRAET